MNTQPSDLTLQLTLAKMLPALLGKDPLTSKVCWLINLEGTAVPHDEVKETEWLHIVWLVEQGLSHEQYEGQSEIFNYVELLQDDCHASWQQRAIALCKVKGIKLVNP